MTSFNFAKSISEIIKNKELVELHFVDAPDEFNVGIILVANDSYLISLEVNPDAVIDGVWVFRTADIAFWQTNTGYLQNLKTKIDLAQVEKEVQAQYDAYRNCHDLLGFVKLATGQGTLVDIKLINQRGIEGTIMGVDGERLLVAEHKTQANILLHLDKIENIATGVSWLKKEAD